MSVYSLEGKVTGIALRNEKTFTTITVADPRFPSSTETIHIETSELSLGEKVTVEISNGE